MITFTNSFAFQEQMSNNFSKFNLWSIILFDKLSLLMYFLCCSFLNKTSLFNDNIMFFIIGSEDISHVYEEISCISALDFSSI